MKSFLHGKRTLSMAALRVPPGLGAHVHTSVPKATRTSEATRKAAGSGNEPNVEVVKEGDRVVRLVVTCVCGEKVEIECLYPTGA